MSCTRSSSRWFSICSHVEPCLATLVLKLRTSPWDQEYAQPQQNYTQPQQEYSQRQNYTQPQQEYSQPQATYDVWNDAVPANNGTTGTTGYGHLESSWGFPRR